MAGVVADSLFGGAPREAAWDLYEMIQAFLQAPSYHLIFEVGLILWIIQLLFLKSYKSEKTMTEQQKLENIEEWVPEPLVPDTDPDHPALHDMKNRLVHGKIGKYVELSSGTCINMATMNFLCMSGREDVEEDAVNSLKKYGVGSCGPRGFYGTVDVHLELEEKLAKYLDVEEVIMYSYGFSTIASAIPAYSKRGDIIFCDEGVHFAIQMGLVASRSNVRYFKHNDLEDLERLLQEQVVQDTKNPKKAKVTRRFMVIEGLYMNHGDLCPLPQLVELKMKYKVRIFMDETLSFGTVGATGKGVTEYYNISMDDIDLMTASLEYSMGAVGGFCAGKAYVIDHQRLSGLGYCFSASTPPMLTQAAISALRIIQENPDMIPKLQENAKYMHSKLLTLPGCRLVGDPVSPVQYLQLAEPSDNRDLDKAILRKIVEMAEEQGVAIAVAALLEKEEHCLPPARIRVSVNVDLTPKEMDRVVEVLQQCYDNVVS